MVEIILKDGTRDVWDGTIAKQDDDQIVVMIGNAPTVAYSRDAVESVRTSGEAANGS